MRRRSSHGSTVALHANPRQAQNDSESQCNTVTLSATPSPKPGLTIDGPSAPRHGRFSLMTPMLVFSCFCIVVGDVLFGYDAGSFGGVLANPGFINHFGHPDAHGKYAISALHTSLASSLAFIGKFIGCLVSGPLIEWLGHRRVFVVLSLVSIVGVILEITATGSAPGSGRLAQFIVGRIVVYVSIGLVEVDVSMYQTEIVPSPLRGLVVASLQLFLNAGGLIATGVNKRYSTSTTAAGWQIVTGIQFIFPVAILLIVPFIPDSPRWLLSKGREEDALTSLRRLRTDHEVSSGACEEELQTIVETLNARVQKAPWIDTIRGTNLRRTVLVLAFYTFQQITGQAFVSTYQTLFYKTYGYADKAYVYPVISSVLSLLAVLPCMFLVDRFGRRPMLMGSFAGQALWLFLMAGFGGRKHKNQAMKDFVVATIMLFNMSFSIGGAPIPYLLGTELPTHALREKTNTLGTTVNVVWAFVTNFAMPYLMARLSFRVGYVFGSIAAAACVCTFLFLPETRGLVLEDIDRVFERRFNPFAYSFGGLGRREGGIVGRRGRGRRSGGVQEEVALEHLRQEKH